MHWLSFYFGNFRETWTRNFNPRDALFLLFNFRDSCVGPALYPPPIRQMWGSIQREFWFTKWTLSIMNWEIRGVFLVDCLQSAFSLKMRLVLISSSAIANHVTITETPSFPAAPDFTARVLRFRVQWLCKEKQETARSLYSWVFVVDCALAFQIVTLDLISGQYLKCRGVFPRGFSLSWP